MSKNHFWYPYQGNKRTEAARIVEESKLEQLDISVIVEPFVGSAAVSFYIGTKYPGKYGYHFNDNNKYLIKLYEICRDDDKVRHFEKKLNKRVKYVEYGDENDTATTHTDKKRRYLKYMKPVSDIYGYYMSMRMSNMRPGLFKQEKDYTYKQYTIKDAPIYKFLRTEYIIFSCLEGTDVINKYIDNPRAWIFVDPPYVSTANSFYMEAGLNIYEYLNQLKGQRCFVCCVFENHWLIRLIFRHWEFVEYDKKYEWSKKRTTHVLINMYGQ